MLALLEVQFLGPNSLCSMPPCSSAYPVSDLSCIKGKTRLSVNMQCFSHNICLCLFAVQHRKECIPG